MESTEDDAGAATNASRRASAREKDSKQTEDIDASKDIQQDSSQDPQAGKCPYTPAILEDDCDSVPSPSSQDVNTSTEAILDMIDDFIDGPGAARRLPLRPKDAVCDPPDLSLLDKIVVESDNNLSVLKDKPSDINSAVIPQELCVSPAVASIISGSSLTTVISPLTDETESASNIDIVSNLTNESLESPETGSVVSKSSVKAASSASLEKKQCASSHIEKQQLILQEEIAVSPVHIEQPITLTEHQNDMPLEVQKVSMRTSNLIELSAALTEKNENLLVPLPKERVACISEAIEEQIVSVEVHEEQNIDSSVVCAEESSSHEVVSSEVVSEPLVSVLEELPPSVVMQREQSNSSANNDEQQACTSWTSNVCHPNMPSSSLSDAIDSSECSRSVRTLKCVTSSITNENVTVESAESTSCDNIVSVPVTRSPLRRRLVRPTRPDTTVSSTVDVQASFSQLPESTNQQGITKDVSSSCDASSSSDAVAILSEQTVESGSQLLNFCEISVCKAETSSLVSTPKKIKLVRNKAMPIPQTMQVKEETLPQQCQSTTLLPKQCSAKILPSALSDVNSSSINFISKPDSITADVPIGISEDKLIDKPSLNIVNLHNENALEGTLQLDNIAQPCSSKFTQDNLKIEAEQRKVPPFKINLNASNLPEQLNVDNAQTITDDAKSTLEVLDTIKQVPKLTIKLGSNSKQNDEIKSPVPKLTIKPVQPTAEDVALSKCSEQIPTVTKLNIKPIPKPPEKINDTHRKSSSSDISESSECSENDETSTSDQASASDQGPSDVIPKVTIKLGKPGTDSEGKFYTEKTVPKLTIKNLQNEEELMDERQYEKIPKLTIKSVTKPDSQPNSPKLTIKPLKPPSDNIRKELTVEHCEVPKLKITQESLSPRETKENSHIPKITIKPVTKSDTESSSKVSKKPTSKSDEYDQIPIVTKLNIKPIPKPTESTEETSECLDEKVPVVSKLNIKPVVKPKEHEIESRIEDIPKVTKLNIKPIKNPEVNDCDEWNSGSDEKCIPVVTKLNIKPIIKPIEEETFKDSENQSSETGNSSDDNGDQIPVVTKLNIKPILRPDSINDISHTANDENIPIVTKLNIKPLVKPEDNTPLSPKKERSSDYRNTEHVPIVTKISIKPIMKPDEIEQNPKDSDESSKNPPLVMKINIKSMTDTSEHKSELKINIMEEPKTCNDKDEVPMVSKINIKPIVKVLDINKTENVESKVLVSELKYSSSDKLHDSVSNDFKSDIEYQQNCVEMKTMADQITMETKKTYGETVINCIRSSTSSANSDLSDLEQTKSSKVQITGDYKDLPTEVKKKHALLQFSQISQKSPTQSCTLLKKLLEETPVSKIEEKSINFRTSNTDVYPLPTENNFSSMNCAKNHTEISDSQTVFNIECSKNDIHTSSNDFVDQVAVNEHITKPLEINTVSDKITSSGQDSPRIILKINKTEHGASSEIITTDDMKIIENEQLTPVSDAKVILNHQKTIANSKRKLAPGEIVNSLIGKRLRSSRVVQEPEKSLVQKRYVGKKSTAVDTTLEHKEPEMTVLESKRVKLGKLLMNKSLTIASVEKDELPITPLSKATQILTPNSSNVDLKPIDKMVNNSVLNNEHCSNKNGNSKLHKILSNLQAKQMQSLPRNDINCTEIQIKSMIPEHDSTNTSTGSSDVVEVPVENSHPEVQEMLINESSVGSRDFVIATDEVAQDPLEVETSKVNMEMMTPQPKKRGRPRKIPASEGAKSIALPVPALEERPQRSLRLSRERPTMIAKPRGGRGRGRGAKRLAESPVEATPIVNLANKFFSDESKTEAEIDPTSARIKLPRMTEALDNMPSTPLSSRRRNSSVNSESQELKVILDTLPAGEVMKSPEVGARRGGRGRGKTPARSPRNKGRGRGGGRGAVYMKETMGIYGRVCGPATTTVQLFEEETCMMDDNATPAKPSHLLDEDSQSSVKSSTNESSKLRKSKFAELFDSNKVWTAADVREYKWPPLEGDNSEQQVMMIQEQVAMFLGVKSFKRRYPELKRRTIGGDEREFVLSQGLVTEALCDLGITAVDASEVLDIMLSDFPHKYEEYRGHQRQRQLSDATSVTPAPPSPAAAAFADRVEMKPELTKPEPPKVDPEKLRQEMAAAAISSASEFNSRLNALRRPACVDLQSMIVHRRRAPPSATRHHLVPPAGLYPHALLPGQYQHTYRLYTPEQLRYFPLNTALSAPPAPASPPAPVATSPADSEDSEVGWSAGSSSEQSDRERSSGAKRKKLTKVRSAGGASCGRIVRGGVLVKIESDPPLPPPPPGETCRVCGLREEANRKFSYERFLACANCHAKLHPQCLELGPDTIRKCRDYAWQCAECKSCCGCQQPADDDKMLFCDLCDRGFHIYCVGLEKVPSGRWHCVECAICKSCGARTPAGSGPSAGGAGTSAGGEGGSAGGEVAEWHHQSKRGPGGHKVYSHSLCTPCARAYRIGRYCPLCERSFIGPKGTMQLVICKLCDRQLHQECVKQTVSNLNVLDYTCGECRRGGITSRAAAARLAPRTIATLFMAKRRFNKYAHRQYMQSRLQTNKTDLSVAEETLTEEPDPPSSPADPLPTEEAVDEV